MRVITLDGPSKTGKTCVGANLVSQLSPEVDGEVRLGVAGDFFRRLAVAVVEEVGPVPCQEDMVNQLAQVIKTEAAFDEIREWGNLHRKEVESIVSTIGKRPEAQVAGQSWYDTFAACAQDDDVGLLIMDGRNPRRVLERVLSTDGTELVLDLLLDCDVETSVRRLKLDEAETARRIAKLNERRAEDAGPPRYVFRYPSPMDTVEFEPIFAEQYPVGLAVDDGVRGAIYDAQHSLNPPATVYLDTAPLSLPQVYSVTTKLARAALNLV